MTPVVPIDIALRYAGEPRPLLEQRYVQHALRQMPPGMQRVSERVEGAVRLPSNGRSAIAAPSLSCRSASWNGRRAKFQPVRLQSFPITIEITIALPTPESVSYGTPWRIGATQAQSPTCIPSGGVWPRWRPTDRITNDTGMSARRARTAWEPTDLLQR